MRKMLAGGMEIPGEISRPTSAYLRKMNAEKGPWRFYSTFLASLTQWRISKVANRVRAFCPGPWPTHESALGPARCETGGFSHRREYNAAHFFGR
jgi:hypothetical protein